MKTGLTVLAVVAAALAGCSLQAPPPASPSAFENQTITQQNANSGNTGTSEQSVGLAPAPGAVSAETSISPGSPVNFVALSPVPMAFIWYGRTDLTDIPVIVSKAGTASRIDFRIRNLGIDCEGLLRFEGSEGFGDWEIFCSDASAAAGILVPVASQSAINGQGIDHSNKSVLFSIPLRN